MKNVNKKDESENKNQIKKLKQKSQSSIYKKEIDLNDEKYTIHQIMPQYDDLWFEINDKDEIIKFEIDKGDVFKRLFSKVPIFIKSICKNIENGEEKFELIYYQPKLKEWQTMVVDKTVLYEKRNITSLSNDGIPITTLNADTWIKYFFKLEEMNYDNIPIIKTTDKLGWNKDIDCFVPYAKNIILDADERLQKWTNAYVSKGTLDEWVNAIKDFRKNKLFRFILSGVFCGPLLKPLNQRIFIIYNYGSSRAGKSAAMFASMSAWGNPEELKTSFYGTSVGIERIARFQNDCALWLDEKQVNKSQTSLEQLVYMLGNGVGKMRGNKTGGVQKLNTWKIMVLASGEETLTNSSSTTGIATRCLEIEGSPFDYKEQIAEKTYETFANCYGRAGEKFIEILVKNYSKNNYELLKQKYNEVKSKLKEKTVNNVHSYISNVAVATLADIIISKELFGEQNEDLSYDMGISILDELNKKEDIDVVEKCYDRISNWIVSNFRRFDKYVDIKKIDMTKLENDVDGGATESLGIYEKGTFYVFRNAVEDFLTHNGYSYNKMVKDFAERKYIVPTFDNNGKIKTPSIQKKYRNVNVRMFAFPMEQVETGLTIKSSLKELGIKFKED